MIRFCAFVGLFLLAAGFAEAGAADVNIMDTPGRVTQIVKTPLKTYFRTGSNSYALFACDDAPVCFKAEPIEGELIDAPETGLPDGKIAVSRSGDIRRAWYGRPTKRYGHGVLGDAIEAGSLIVEDRTGNRYEHVLDRNHVFEDITPRLFDLDRDGDIEIVAIRSSLSKGAAIAVHGIVDGALKELAATRDIGRSNRWLNIAGIADYPGAGVAAIAWIETPHIGGILRMGVFDGKNFEVFSNSYPGFSNHFIGSRELGLSATGDFTDDGVPDLAIPSAGRNQIVIAARTGLVSIPLPGRVGHAVAAVGDRIVTADTEGRLIVVQP